MIYLKFPNNYFDKAVETAQDSFERDMRNTDFKDFVKGCFDNVNLMYT